MLKKLNLILIFVFIILGFISSAQATISVIDDKGRIVKLNNPANRIISLAPHITESLFAAGAGDKIIGAVAYSDYPEEAKQILRVGGYPTLDVEMIVSLKPDLVVAWSSGNNSSQVEKLISLGLTVFISEPRNPEDIAKTIQRFGVLSGTDSIASKSYNDFIQHYHSLKERFSNKEKVKVFYQIWNKPLITINGEHLISDIINLCGGINVFSELHSLTPKISLEAVIAAEVDAIVLGAQEEKKLKWMAEWKQWVQLVAVKKQQIYLINPDLLNRVGPRVLHGADKLCDILENVRNN